MNTRSILACLAVAGPLSAMALLDPLSPRFERRYYPVAPAHLTLSNFNGDVTFTSWNRKEIWIRASSSRVPVEDRVTGRTIEIVVKQGLPVSRVDFEARVPPGTSVSLKNRMGKIKVRGLTGHINVDAFEGSIQLTDVRSPRIEVKVISGDVFFDGDFTGAGPYAFQSMKGDIDLTLPSTTPFQFAGRALKDKINVDEFQFNQFSQQPKQLAGNHLKGGPRLVITAYDGSIILHKR